MNVNEVEPVEGFVVLGAGGHAKVVLDILKSNGEKIYGLTDAEQPKGTFCLGVPVLGTDEVLKELIERGIKKGAMGIGHVGNPHVRNQVYAMAVRSGLSFPNLIHPKAAVSDSVHLGNGNLIGAGSVINPEVSIGDLCIINTSAVVEHEVTIESGVHTAPHSTILGGASVGENSFVGAGVVVLQGVHVGKNCIIGAGSVVLTDVEDNSVVVGNPGKVLRRR